MLVAAVILIESHVATVYALCSGITRVLVEGAQPWIV